MTTEEGLLGHGSQELTSDEEVHLVAELLNKLVSGRRVEDVALHRHVLIVQQVQQAKSRRIRNAVSESRFSELRRNGL